MLFQRRQSRWLFAKLRQVMMEECSQYRRHEQPHVDAEIDEQQWERFIDVAQSNIKMSKQSLAPLVETAECWGMDKVHHYEWTSTGRKFCQVLGSAASRTPVWEEALVKLNQLLLRRITEGRSLRSSVNPVYILDLERLIAWPDKSDFEKKGRKPYVLKYESIMECDLPAGYTFDQYGLIVAVQSQGNEIACRMMMEPESPACLYDSESDVTRTITPSNSSCFKTCYRGYQLLQIATLAWCVLLATLSWWYKRP
jgi:hypothetical protein